VPDDGSCELKHVAQYYVTLKCRVGRCTSVVGDIKNTTGFIRKKRSMCGKRV